MTDRQKFVDNLKDTAIAGWDKYKVLPSIFAAQTCLETGFGTSDLAKKANNYWGIKHHGTYEGYAYFYESPEVINGVTERVISPFRVFEDFSEGVDGYYNTFLGHLSKEAWRKEGYADVVGETDYVKAANALIDDVGLKYATDPAYADKLINIINQYKLYEWDKEATASEVETYEIKENEVIIDGEKYLIREVKEED